MLVGTGKGPRRFQTVCGQSTSRIWRYLEDIWLIYGWFVTELDYSKIGPALGDQFPDFELPDSEGRPVSLQRWRNGRRAIVVFYRSAAW